VAFENRPEWEEAFTPTMSTFGSPRDPKPCLGGMATCSSSPIKGEGFA
jgi:hypothetical protein